MSSPASLFAGLVSDVKHREYLGFPRPGTSVRLPAGGFISHLEICWGEQEGEARLCDSFGAEIPLEREGDAYFPAPDYGEGPRRDVLPNTDARGQYRLMLTARADIHIVWLEVSAPNSA